MSRCPSAHSSQSASCPTPSSSSTTQYGSSPASSASRTSPTPRGGPSSSLSTSPPALLSPGRWPGYSASCQNGAPPRVASPSPSLPGCWPPCPPRQRLPEGRYGRALDGQYACRRYLPMIPVRGSAEQG